VIRRDNNINKKKLSVAIAGIYLKDFTCTLRNRMHPTRINITSFCRITSALSRIVEIFSYQIAVAIFEEYFVILCNGKFIRFLTEYLKV
jgi:hypothetical protein